MRGKIMKISEPQLYKVYYTQQFQKFYLIDPDVPLVLNSINVYAVKDEWVQEKVDFDIFTDKNGDRYIRPNYPSEECSHFLLTGERLARCKVIEIKADECVSYFEHDGSFTFTIEAEE